MTLKQLTILKYTFNALGGLEKQTNSIIASFLKEGYKVSVLTTKHKNSLKLHTSFHNVNFHFIKKMHCFSFLKVLFFEKKTSSWIKKHKPKIVLGMDRTTTQTHIRAGNGTHRSYLEKRKKYYGKINYFLCKINPLHILILHIEKKAFENPFLKKIIVNSDMVKSEILKYYKVNPSKIEVVHNGTKWADLEKVFEESFLKKDEIAKSLNIPPENYNFLFIGNGYKRKGLKTALLSLAKLSKTNKNFNFLIVGKDKEINKYKKYAKSLGIFDNTYFFNEQKNSMPFYQVSDALFLPTYYDPFANTTIEALAMGLFVITSKENGGKEIINRENGRIINDLLNVDDIAATLKQALKTPKTKQMAQAIRNGVKNLELSDQLNKVTKAILNND